MTELLLRPLKRYLTDILVSNLSTYLEGVELEGLGILSSDVVLSNVELRVDALNALLPAETALHLRRGFAKELRLHIPWTSLLSAPIEIQLDTVECILSPTTSTAAQHRPSRQRQDHKPAPPPPSALPEWIQSRITRIVANATVRVRNLIIKLRHGDTDVVASLRSLTVASADPRAEWAPGIAEPEGPFQRVAKTISMLDFTLTCDSAMAMVGGDAARLRDRGRSRGQSSTSETRTAPPSSPAQQQAPAATPLLPHPSVASHVSESEQRNAARARSQRSVTGTADGAAIYTEEPLLSRANFYGRLLLPLDPRAGDARPGGGGDGGGAEEDAISRASSGRRAPHAAHPNAESVSGIKGGTAPTAASDPMSQVEAAVAELLHAAVDPFDVPMLTNYSSDLTLRVVSASHIVHNGERADAYEAHGGSSSVAGDATTDSSFPRRTTTASVSTEVPVMEISILSDELELGVTPRQVQLLSDLMVSLASSGDERKEADAFRTVNFSGRGSARRESHKDTESEAENRRRHRRNQQDTRTNDLERANGGALHTVHSGRNHAQRLRRSRGKSVRTHNVANVVDVLDNDGVAHGKYALADGDALSSDSSQSTGSRKTRPRALVTEHSHTSGDSESEVPINATPPRTGFRRGLMNWLLSSVGAADAGDAPSQTDTRGGGRRQQIASDHDDTATSSASDTDIVEADVVEADLRATYDRATHSNDTETSRRRSREHRAKSSHVRARSKHNTRSTTRDESRQPLPERNPYSEALVLNIMLGGCSLVLRRHAVSRASTASAAGRHPDFPSLSTNNTRADGRLLQRPPAVSGASADATFESPSAYLRVPVARLGYVSISMSGGASVDGPGAGENVRRGIRLVPVPMARLHIGTSTLHARVLRDQRSNNSALDDSQSRHESHRRHKSTHYAQADVAKGTPAFACVDAYVELGRFSVRAWDAEADTAHAIHAAEVKVLLRELVSGMSHEGRPPQQQGNSAAVSAPSGMQRGIVASTVAPWTSRAMPGRHRPGARASSGSTRTELPATCGCDDDFGAHMASGASGSWGSAVANGGSASALQRLPLISCGTVGEFNSVLEREDVAHNPYFASSLLRVADGLLLGGASLEDVEIRDACARFRVSVVTVPQPIVDAQFSQRCAVSSATYMIDVTALLARVTVLANADDALLLDLSAYLTDTTSMTRVAHGESFAARISAESAAVDAQVHHEDNANVSQVHDCMSPPPIVFPSTTAARVTFHWSGLRATVTHLSHFLRDDVPVVTNAALSSTVLVISGVNAMASFGRPALWQSAHDHYDSAGQALGGASGTLHDEYSSLLVRPSVAARRRNAHVTTTAEAIEKASISLVSMKLKAISLLGDEQDVVAIDSILATATRDDELVVRHHRPRPHRRMPLHLPRGSHVNFAGRTGSVFVTLDAPLRALGLCITRLCQPRNVTSAERDTGPGNRLATAPTLPLNAAYNCQLQSLVVGASIVTAAAGVDAEASANISASVTLGSFSLCAIRRSVSRAEAQEFDARVLGKCSGMQWPRAGEPTDASALNARVSFSRLLLSAVPRPVLQAFLPNLFAAGDDRVRGTGARSVTVSPPQCELLCTSAAAFVNVDDLWFVYRLYGGPSLLANFVQGKSLHMPQPVTIGSASSTLEALRSTTSRAAAFALHALAADSAIIARHEVPQKTKSRPLPGRVVSLPVSKSYTSIAGSGNATLQVQSDLATLLGQLHARVDIKPWRFEIHDLISVHLRTLMTSPFHRLAICAPHVEISTQSNVNEARFTKLHELSSSFPRAVSSTQDSTSTTLAIATSLAWSIAALRISVECSNPEALPESSTAQFVLASADLRGTLGASCAWHSLREAIAYDGVTPTTSVSATLRQLHPSVALRLSVMHASMYAHPQALLIATMRLPEAHGDGRADDDKVDEWPLLVSQNAARQAHVADRNTEVFAASVSLSAEMEHLEIRVAKPTLAVASRLRKGPSQSISRQSDTREHATVTNDVQNGCDGGCVVTTIHGSAMTLLLQQDGTWRCTATLTDGSVVPTDILGQQSTALLNLAPSRAGDAWATIAMLSAVADDPLQIAVSMGVTEASIDLPAVVVALVTATEYVHIITSAGSPPPPADTTNACERQILPDSHADIESRVAKFGPEMALLHAPLLDVVLGTTRVVLTGSTVGERLSFGVVNVRAVVGRTAGGGRDFLLHFSDVLCQRLVVRGYHEDAILRVPTLLVTLMIGISQRLLVDTMPSDQITRRSVVCSTRIEVGGICAYVSVDVLRTWQREICVLMPHLEAAIQAVHAASVTTQSVSEITAPVANLTPMAPPPSPTSAVAMPTMTYGWSAPILSISAEHHVHASVGRCHLTLADEEVQRESTKRASDAANLSTKLPVYHLRFNIGPIDAQADVLLERHVHPSTAARPLRRKLWHSKSRTVAQHVVHDDATALGVVIASGTALPTVYGVATYVASCEGSVDVCEVAVRLLGTSTPPVDSQNIVHSRLMLGDSLDDADGTNNIELPNTPTKASQSAIHGKWFNAALRSFPRPDVLPQLQEPFTTHRSRPIIGRLRLARLTGSSDFEIARFLIRVATRLDLNVVAIALPRPQLVDQQAAGASSRPSHGATVVMLGSQLSVEYELHWNGCSVIASPATAERSGAGHALFADLDSATVSGAFRRLYDIDAATGAFSARYPVHNQELQVVDAGVVLRGVALRLSINCGNDKITEHTLFAVPIIIDARVRSRILVLPFVPTVSRETGHQDDAIQHAVVPMGAHDYQSITALRTVVALRVHAVVLRVDPAMVGGIFSLTDYTLASIGSLAEGESSTSTPSALSGVRGPELAASNDNPVINASGKLPSCEESEPIELSLSRFTRVAVDGHGVFQGLVATLPHPLLCPDDAATLSLTHIDGAQSDVTQPRVIRCPGLRIVRFCHSSPRV